MSDKWRITITDPGPWPKPHPFKVDPPTDCGCGWVSTTLAEALRVVDAFVWLERHPEFDGCFDGFDFREHLDHCRNLCPGGER